MAASHFFSTDVVMCAACRCWRTQSDLQVCLVFFFHDFAFLAESERSHGQGHVLDGGCPGCSSHKGAPRSVPARAAVAACEGHCAPQARVRAGTSRPRAAVLCRCAGALPPRSAAPMAHRAARSAVEAACCCGSPARGTHTAGTAARDRTATSRKPAACASSSAAAAAAAAATITTTASNAR